MTLERLAQLAHHPDVAPYVHAGALSAQTALTLYHARRAGLLTPAEVAQYADLPRPWIEVARSTVSGMTDQDLASLHAEPIARAVATTLGAPARWAEVVPLVVRRQTVLAQDGYHAAP